MKKATCLILILFLISCETPTEVIPEYQESIDEIIQSNDSL